MKKVTILFLILWGIVGTASVKAQKSVQDALAYYPLQIGNEWQYHYTHREKWLPDLGYINVKVTGDTLMNDNHRRYQVVQYHYHKKVAGWGNFAPDSLVIWYERVDSVTANVYRKTPSGEELRDSLMIQVEDTIWIHPNLEFTTCYDTTRWQVFSTTHSVKRLFWFAAVFEARHYDLAKGLGIIYNYYKDEGTLGDTDTLIYARINGVTYGTYVETPATPIEHIPQFSRPYHFLLHQNYPNPFNPTTTIRYELARTGRVRLAVYNMLGQRVSVLVDARQKAGAHQARFDASHLSSGVYFYRLQTGDKMLVRKMLLMK